MLLFLSLTLVCLEFSHRFATNPQVDSVKKDTGSGHIMSFPGCVTIFPLYWYSRLISDRNLNFGQQF